jgi:uncharacterized protein YndB with AHSA1/START domain
MRWKHWLMTLMILAVFGLAGVWGAGSVLPSEQPMIRGIFVKAPVDKVWEALTNYEEAPRWSSAVAARRMPARGGKEVWALENEGGQDMVLLVEAQQAPTMHHIRLLEGTRFFEATWLFQLTPQPHGTFVKLTQTSTISNPLMRFLADRLHLLDKGMTQYLQMLGQKFGDAVKVEELVA